MNCCFLHFSFQDSSGEWSPFLQNVSFSMRMPTCSTDAVWMMGLHPDELMVHLWWSSDASLLKGQRAWGSRSQGEEWGPARMSLGQREDARERWGRGMDRDSAACLQREVQLSRYLQCVLQDLCSAYFRVSKPNRSSSQTSGWYLTTSMSKQPNNFSLPSLCLPICLFCRRRRYMSWGDSPWAGVGKQCSVTSRSCYFTVRGNS